MATWSTANNKVFRTPTSTSSVLFSTSYLYIPLHAFAPSSYYPSNILPTGSITIPAKTLYTFLQEAESTASMIGKKRRREITPEEELLKRDKKKFKTKEDKALELETKDNRSFVGSEGS
ncbi:hypothetical protein BKA61DRAFT_679358 [Leptodontidium sp. MPI-SDFR-AT-0119]|nr:hypothetical protein BKA61DRAFT_679358 [Leptodontidium sp. MPI-SDFR-AT-0119]